jgi:hypothetical protein
MVVNHAIMMMNGARIPWDFVHRIQKAPFPPCF